MDGHALKIGRPKQLLMDSGSVLMLLGALVLTHQLVGASARAPGSGNREHLFVAFALWLLGAALVMLSLVAGQFFRLTYLQRLTAQAAMDERRDPTIGRRQQLLFDSGRVLMLLGALVLPHQLGTSAPASGNAEHLFVAFILWLLGAALTMLSLVTWPFPRHAADDTNLRDLCPQDDAVPTTPAPTKLTPPLKSMAVPVTCDLLRPLPAPALAAGAADHRLIRRQEQVLLDSGLIFMLIAALVLTWQFSPVPGEYVLVAFLLWLLGTAAAMLSLVARRVPTLTAAGAAAATALRSYLLGGL